MEITINISKQKKSNEDSVTQVGRAILKQGKIRKYSDMEGMERERERLKREI